MKRILILFLPLTVFSLFAIAQTDTGVHFEDSLTWRQILEKAKRENKFIFLDCFASWCGPCKQMDQIVYTSGELGDYMNSRFISVKVQFDTTAHDDAFVQTWYADARAIMQTYHIRAFPSFLFFAPDGSIVHRDLGYHDGDQFLQLAKDAQDPGLQYYTLLKRFENGEKNFAGIDKVAELAQSVGDTGSARMIADEYINHYMMELDQGQLYTAGNIQMIVSFLNMLKPDGSFFSLFFPDGSKVDSVMGAPGYSSQIVDMIIQGNMIKPAVEEAKSQKGNIDWDGLRKQIAQKYNTEIANRTILKSKVDWYRYCTKQYNKEWGAYIDNQIKVIQLYEADSNKLTDVLHNNFAYQAIFFHSTQKSQIYFGVHLMEGVVRRDPTSPSHIDTYANLLYKAGERTKAIEMEKEALHLSPDDASIDQNYEKMKKGEPTWL